MQTRRWRLEGRESLRRCALWNELSRRFPGLEQFNVNRLVTRPGLQSSQARLKKLECDVHSR